MNQVLLHVVIPAFGESPYLRQTLESAVKYLPPEVLITVLEDPSNKSSLQILVEEFPRVTYVKNDFHLGIGGNFNRAIDLSKGIFTQICGSDDVFIGNPLGVFDSKKLISNEIFAIGLDVNVIDKQGRTVKTLPDQIKRVLRPKMDLITIFDNKKLFSSLMLGDWLYFPAILWKTDTIKRTRFGTNLHTAVDLDVIIRSINNNKKMAFINIKALSYRRHDQSASSLYAKSTGRFEEEFKCHKNAIEIAQNKNWRMGVILAQLALTVRLHAIMQSFLMVFTSPLSALKVLVKAISPIR